MLHRDPIYYVTGYKGNDPYEAPFYLRALVFDGKPGEFNSSLIGEFNDHMAGQRKYISHFLDLPEGAPAVLPSRIVIINASHDNLPTSYETARIFEEYCRGKNIPISVRVVNDRETLICEAGADPRRTLVMSQCVDKAVYDTVLSDILEKEGTVTVPGRVTAPGGVFSDKDSTYRLLSDNGKRWDMVARYVKVPVEGKNIDSVVEGIFGAVSELHLDTGEDTFFVKPHEGGGGLGGFRISRFGNGYIIPDLSKVSGEMSGIHPAFIDVDISDKAKLTELLWIYRFFAGDGLMTRNYLSVKLPVLDVPDDEALEVMKEYLVSSREKRVRKLSEMVMGPREARKALCLAIERFEAKFAKRYTPLVNEHIDFGLWGLRAHYRMSRKGPVLETMYHRIFQLGFTPEGPGYLGADNISNKQTGDLEILRLGPVNEIMLDAIGGRSALFDTLGKGAEALIGLAGLLPETSRRKVPLRAQFDLAAVSRRIGEGNADTARGLCLASKWDGFVGNAEEWLEDSLSYYSWVKEQGSLITSR